MVRIPGTTFYLQFSIEGKYYAISLVQGRLPIKSRKLDALRGTAKTELTGEIETGLQALLEEENLYINPVVVDRVITEFLEKIPEEGQSSTREISEERKIIPETAVKVSEMIKKSDDRAGKTSMVEHKPITKPKYDASAESISHYNLRTPRPLPQKESIIEQETVTSSIENTTEIEKENKIVLTSTIQTEKYIQLEEKIVSLTNEINNMQQKIDSTSKEITNLKKQITTLKNKLKDPTYQE